MRINKKSDLPKWFDIKNYNSLNSLSDIQLFEQIKHRYILLSCVEYHSLEDIESSLSDGVVEVTSVKMDYFQQAYEDMFNITGNVLSHRGGVDALTIYDVSGFITEVEKFNNKINMDDHIIIMMKQMKSINLIINDERHRIFANIDLSWPDEMLLKDIELLLPIWRSELGISVENEPINTSWDVLRRKVIDYALIPMVDLVIWEKKTGNKITNGVLAVTLFPEGDYDSTQIAQTVKRYLENLFNYFSIEKLKRDFSNRGYPIDF